VASMWIVPLGRTPDYLDPQCQEALHEVDVSGMALLRSFEQYQRGAPSGDSKGGTGWDRSMTK
jgi:hypothetical protein